MSKPSAGSGCPIHPPMAGADAVNSNRLGDILEAAPDAMIVVDDLGIISFLNSQTEKLFGFSRQELLGQRIEILMPARFRSSHAALRGDYSRQPRVRGMGGGLELCGMRKDQTEFPVEISLAPLKTERGTFVISAIRDTSERQKIERKLRESLKEKEVLLKEVHHRVKNNLQVVSSLLNFQADLIKDEEARSAFRDTRSRIKSIALLHERLYQSDDLSHINFADYVIGIMDDLYDSFGVDRRRVKVGVDIDAVVLDVDTVVNCGLIVNELVSNALKYAFPAPRSGLISVSLKRHGEDSLELRVADDGVGLPAGDALLQKPTLGLKLVRGLSRELGGSLTVRGEQGAIFQVIFPLVRSFQ